MCTSDFARPNLLSDGKQLWVLDWEESCPDGPMVLDALMFDMQINYQWNASDPAGSVTRYQRSSTCPTETSDASLRRRADVLAILAFMHGVGHIAAVGLVTHWRARGGR